MKFIDDLFHNANNKILHHSFCTYVSARELTWKTYQEMGFSLDNIKDFTKEYPVIGNSIISTLLQTASYEELFNYVSCHQIDKSMLFSLQANSNYESILDALSGLRIFAHETHPNCVFLNGEIIYSLIKE